MQSYCCHERINESGKPFISSPLARFRPKEYPILKDAHGEMMFENISPEPLADSPDGPTISAPPPPPPPDTSKLGGDEK